MIPAPNLDDRTFEDIVQEALTLIPKYCPDWTNYNPSDPGVTLIELFAWMTEMILYRLNKVTDKNYLKFLELMGIQLQPPQPAQALLKFELVEGAKEPRPIAVGTQAATEQTGDEDAIVYETARNLLVLPTKLEKCYSQFHDEFEEHTDLLDGQKTDGFPIFYGERRVERILYIGDERFSKLTDAAMLRLNFTTPESVGTDFPRFIEWEYWNGRRWKEMLTSAMEFDRGEVVFEQIEQIETCEVSGRESHWIRGRLVEVPQSSNSTMLDTVKAQIEIIGEGVEPDLVLTNDDANTYLPRDLSKNFAPFSDHPKPDTVLYIASEEYLSQAGAQVRIEVRLSDPKIKDLPQAHPDLQVAWEYYDGRGWQELARVTPEGVEESLDGSEFEDSTVCFTKSGSIAFVLPEDLKQSSVNELENHWVRARIIQGNYGEPGQYELDGDRWVWRNENPLKPPYIKAMRLNYAEPSSAPTHVVSYNDFHFTDHSDQAAQEMKPFQPFTPVAEESPTLYLGFSQAFPNAEVGIYFNTSEPLALDQATLFAERLHRYYASQTDQQHLEQRVVWEYWDGSSWSNLNVTDQTQNLARSGFVDFIGPKNFETTKRFGETLYWIRARLEMGGYVELPRLNYISLNCVYALNQQTIRNELLGSSNGMPNQVFYLRNTPVLDDEEIWIREREPPTELEIEGLKEALKTDKVTEQPTDGGGGLWVRWQPVDSFYASTPRSRHYKKEPITGEIRFGIGSKGMAPPMGENNVFCREYRVGGGAKGNVGPGTINTLRRAIEHVDMIYNPYPAQGGSDQETVEEVKERGPYMIRSRSRAVTKEDFEWLCLQASNSIARATCLPSANREGEVTVIVVPKFDEASSDYREKLVPSTELLRRVKRFLDDRRLVTTILHVIKPRYVEVSVQVEVVKSPTGSAERVRRQVEQALRMFLHPIRGGRNAKGWPFGRTVLKMDLYRVIEEVDGVDFVGKIRLIDEDRSSGGVKFEVEQIKLRATELPYLVDVEITEKSRENII
ncbi:MAG: putative baseplate assembly protein [Myxococcales bacterium]|nr:putative baseplate assembly protein [Myxococcales bacterium]